MRAIAILALLVTSPAYGYVRALSSTGTPLDRRGKCPQLELGGPSNPALSTERLSAALMTSADAWNTPTASCANPRIVVATNGASASDIGYDGTNLVIWRLPGFCDVPSHHQDDVCTARNAAAVTTVFFIDKPGSARDGELLEADVELNAVDFNFSDQGVPDRVDLVNTITHEFGHVLGLDHTCYTVPGSAPAIDSTGAAVPSCFPLSALPAEATQATMFNFETPGEIDKRAPTTAETEGVCAIYAGHSTICHGSEGCSIAPATHAVSLALTLLVVAALLWARRRGRRRS